MGRNMTKKIMATSRSVIKKVLSNQEKRDYYKAWESSGMPKRDFCKKNGLSVNQLHYWHKLFNKKSVVPPKSFSPVVAKMISSESQQDLMKLEIRLPNQAQLLITLHQNQLISFIQELSNAATIIR
jgi:hypothetical protein